MAYVNITKYIILHLKKKKKNQKKSNSLYKYVEQL